MMETSLNRAPFSAGCEVTAESWMAASHLPRTADFSTDRLSLKAAIYILAGALQRSLHLVTTRHLVVVRRDAT